MLKRETSSDWIHNNDLQEIDFPTIEMPRFEKTFAHDAPFLLQPLIDLYRENLTFPLLWSNDAMQIPIALFSPEVPHHALAYFSFVSIRSHRQISQKDTSILTASLTLASLSDDPQFVQEVLDSVGALPIHWEWTFVKVPKTFFALITKVTTLIDWEAIRPNLSCSATESIQSVAVSSQIFSH